MTKILDEVRAISSDAIAKKQDSAKVNLPQLIEDIKKAAALGKTECIFRQHEIDQYAKKLLEAEGFRVYSTTRAPLSYDKLSYLPKEPEPVWQVTWL